MIMTQITTPISLRISNAERDYLLDLAETQGLSIGQAARVVIQQAMQDGRDMSRLAALENRLAAKSDEINSNMKALSLALGPALARIIKAVEVPQ
jgi:hypothetical protein